MKVLERYNIEDFFFFDIETIPGMDSMDERTIESWGYKKKLNVGDETELNVIKESYYKEAALYPEYGKVICFSYAYYENNVLKIGSIINENEESLVCDIHNLLNDIENLNLILCGHNIKGFDIPFLAKRFVVNKLRVHNKLDFSHCKPWDINVIDTMDLWKFGGTKNSSLNDIAYALNIPSPKEEMSGSQVYEEYKKGNISKIKEYCEKDTLTLERIVNKLMNND